MNAGDVAWEGHGPNGQVVRVGVEVKTVADFLSSKRSGRLSGTQLPRLRSLYDDAWLLVEGITRPGHHGNLEVMNEWHRWQKGFGQEIPYGEFAGGLVSFVLRGGLALARTSGRDETVAWLLALIRWWHQPWDSHTTHKQPDRSQFHDPDIREPTQAEEILMAIRGLGRERARVIAAHFRHDVPAMLRAPLDEWDAAWAGKVTERGWRILHGE
jgi:ERCC4-type nuclease